VKKQNATNKFDLKKEKNKIKKKNRRKEEENKRMSN